MADDSPAAENRQFGILLLATVIVVLILAGAYWFLTGPAWRMIDPGRHHSRMILIKETLDGLPRNPEHETYLALGDSICMSAFDSDVFEAEMGGSCAAYNLAQSGKAMPELLFERSHDRVRESRVVLFITPLTTFTPDYINVYPRKANFYRVLDYPYDIDTWKEYADNVPTANAGYVMRSKAFHAFELRWLVSNNLISNTKGAVVGGLKRVLGKPVGGTQLTCDYSSVRYPGWDNDTPRPDFQEHHDLLAEAKPGLFAGEFNPDEAQLTSFRFVMGKLSSCREVILVKAPLHPRIREELGPGCLADFSAVLDGLAGGNVRVVDLMDSMPAEAFRDALHIVPDYADDVTRRLCEELAGEDG